MANPVDAQVKEDMANPVDAQVEEEEARVNTALKLADAEGKKEVAGADLADEDLWLAQTWLAHRLGWRRLRLAQT